MASFTVMAGAVSACFMPRLMVCASLYACSICWSLFHRRVLIRTVTVRGVRSNIAVIIIVVYTLRVQRYNKSRKVPNFPPDKYPLWCVSKSKNDMVPFGRNPKSALSEQRSSDQQMGGEQQDECRPRGAEGVNDSVHFVLFLLIVYTLFNILGWHTINGGRRAHLSDVSTDIIFGKGEGA